MLQSLLSFFQAKRPHADLPQITYKSINVNGDFKNLDLKSKGAINCDYNVHYNPNISNPNVYFSIHGNDKSKATHIRSMEADTNNDILSILVVSDEKVYSWELPEVNVSITLPDKKIETLNHESTIGSLFFSGLKHRPFNEFRSISVVGDCVLKDLSVENDTTIETTTGSISIENLDSRNLRINATVGSVKVNASMIKDFCAINTITGSSKLVDVAAKNILLSATTGSIRAKLNNVQTLDCSTTMGSIHTDLFIADTNNAQIKLQSTTGSISSELTGFSGKFDTRTSFGSSTIYGADTISTEKNNTFGKIGRSGGILTALVSTGSLKLKFN